MTPTKTHSACGRCVVARCAIPIGSPLARLSAEVRCQGEAIGAGRTQFENGLTVWAASRTADLSLLGWPHHAASLLSGRRHRYHPTDAKAAHRYCQLQLIDLTVDEPFVGFGLLAEGYNGGKATQFEPRSENGWSNPTQGVAVEICVCLQIEQWPDLDRTKRVGGTYQQIQGTGSMRLGCAFRISKSSQCGDSVLVSNTDFDLHLSTMVKCKDLPFTIVNRHNKTRTVPVVAVFPRKFDIKSLNGEVDAPSLPDGTLVVYGVIKKEV